MRSISFIFIALVVAAVVPGVSAQTANTITISIFGSTDTACVGATIGQPYVIPNQVCTTAPDAFQKLGVTTFYLESVNDTSEWNLRYFTDGNCQDGEYYNIGRGNQCSSYTDESGLDFVYFTVNIPITSPCSMSLYKSGTANCLTTPIVTFGLGSGSGCISTAPWAPTQPIQSWNFTLTDDATFWQLQDYTDDSCTQLSDQSSGTVDACSTHHDQLVTCGEAKKLISEN